MRVSMWRGLWARAPRWGLAATLVCALLAPAAAQPKRPAPKPAPAADATRANDANDAKPAAKKREGKDKVKTFDFTGLDLSGRLRTPQLLYFLERANEELERASLKKRTFIPHMVRSVEDERL